MSGREENISKNLNLNEINTCYSDVIFHSITLNSTYCRHHLIAV